MSARHVFSDELGRFVHAVVKDIFRSMAEELESTARDERMDSAASSALYSVAHVMECADFAWHVNEALDREGFNREDLSDD